MSFFTDLSSDRPNAPAVADLGSLRVAQGGALNAAPRSCGAANGRVLTHRSMPSLSLDGKMVCSIINHLDTIFCSEMDSPQS